MSASSSETGHEAASPPAASPPAPSPARRLRLPRVIGHRGAAAHAPENTLASIRRAARDGARWVEFDVMLTRDSVPVLFHDDSLERTTGAPGDLAERPFDAVRGLDAGSAFDPAFAGERVPSLEETLALLAEEELCADLEIKPSPGRDVETALETLRAIEAHWPAGREAPLICSFSLMSLAAVRALKPDWPLALNVEAFEEGWRQQLAALNCVSYHIWDRYVTEAIPPQVHEAGYQIAVYTVNDPARARQLLDWGVDCIITDDPGAMLAALG